MKPLTISGIQFYVDDTVEVIRQLLALQKESHPLRMYVEALVPLEIDHYSTNPKRWMDLFFRLSTDGRTISESTLKTYVTQIRPDSKAVPTLITREEWEAVDQRVRDLHSPDAPFNEWRVFGVPEEESIILPSPPEEVSIPATRIPFPRSQRLFERLYPDGILDFRVTEATDDMTEKIKNVYFPQLTPDTPASLSALEASIRSSRTNLDNLFALRVPQHQSASIVKAKWFVPLVSTEISAPYARFEQIFYGLTVSKQTPYIGYFTSKTETVRSKFYVEDPKVKEPLLNTTYLRSWMSRTFPQRRRPTLLLYRGVSNTEFDRICITETDITFQSERFKDSKETLEELQASLFKWFQSLDAVVPFFAQTDLDLSRWELSDMSLVASYSREIRGFNMNRFQCLRPVFSVQNNTFRLLRADQVSDEIPIDLLQTYQYLQENNNPSYVAEQMNISLEKAQELIEEVTRMSETRNLEGYIKSYPIFRFFTKEVYIRFVLDPERSIEYANLLRYVLTSDSDDVQAVCPERLQEVRPVGAVARPEEEEGDDLALEFLQGYIPEIAEEAPQQEEVREEKPRLRQVAPKQATTYNYFNNRLKTFDSETFDQSFYNSECEKLNQVIVLTKEDKERLGPKYNYDDAPETEKFELEDPDGTAICPPYWCMRDEIPLRKDQLEVGKDGELQCPVCAGKVRPDETVDPAEYTVIERNEAFKYPKAMLRLSTRNGRKVPCCYIRQPKKKELAEEESKKTNTSYILQADVPIVPELRAAYLSEQLAAVLRVDTNYDKSVKKGKIVLKEADVFRIGLGRPSKSLPILFGTTKPIPNPKDAPEIVKKCSFFLTRRSMASGDTSVERLLDAVNSEYVDGTLPILDEVEYVTSFLECEVLRVDIRTNQVLCGFWSDRVVGSNNTIVLLGDDILGIFSKDRIGRTIRSKFMVNITKAPFAKTTLPHLQALSKEACHVGVPVYDSAVAELRRLGKALYEVILDPFGRAQALFVPREVVLPILPTTWTPQAGVKVHDGYYDISEDQLPFEHVQRAALRDSLHSGYKITRSHTDVKGNVVELEVATGFRIPIRAETTKSGPPSELTETLRIHDEKTLVEGKPKAEDTKLTEEITYRSEILDFLLFSLSKDIQTDDYSNLRAAIEFQTRSLGKELEKWFKAEAYQESTKSPVQFVNKVRTPCGQLTSEDTCSKSSLCGWHKGDCKIRIKKPLLNGIELVPQLVKILRTNSKKRMLVLDGALSPFFSTVLYLEMPNELITTSF